MSRHDTENVEESADRQTLRRRLLEGLPVTERTIEVDGVSTRVVEGGDGAPVVLLHGQSGSALAWLPNIDALASSHHVIAPDLPGLGESVVKTGELDADRAVSWLHGLVEAACDEPPTLVGLSLGGSIAARFGIRHPGAARRIVLVDSGSLGPFRPDLRIIPALVRVSVRPTPRNIERLFRYTFVDLDRFTAPGRQVAAVHRLRQRPVDHRERPGRKPHAASKRWHAEDRRYRPRRDCRPGDADLGSGRPRDETADR